MDRVKDCLKVVSLIYLALVLWKHEVAYAIAAGILAGGIFDGDSFAWLGLKRQKSAAKTPEEALKGQEIAAKLRLVREDDCA